MSDAATADGQSSGDKFRGLFAELDACGLLEFGESFDADVVRRIMGITMPAVGTKAQFDQAALAELAAVDYCRNVLLGQGKYLAGIPGGYRVLLPSENQRQIELYMQSADKKLSRALKLSRNTPNATADNSHQLHARIHLKQTGLRDMPGSIRKQQPPSNPASLLN